MNSEAININGDGNVVGNNNQTFVIKGATSEAIATALTGAFQTSRALYQLRSPVTDFVGRESQYTELVTTLQNGGCTKICGISGLGGAGKTELALKIAEELTPQYPDAQLFVDLRGTDEIPRDPTDALVSCIRGFLGPEVTLPSDIEELATLYRAHLNGKRALIVLDNAADAKQIRPLLPPSTCVLIVTSRPLIAVAGMKRLRLEQLTPDEACRLLQSIAPRIVDDVASDIAVMCGFLPLALRAAGSLLDVTIDLRPEDYAKQLRDERTRLRRLGVEGVEIGVEASFNLSYARLPSETQEVFQRISVFPTSFDVLAEEGVCDDADHVQLSYLTRYSLVQYDPTSERYYMHDLVRLFANRLIRDSGELYVAQHRYATYYLDVARRAEILVLEGGEGIVLGLQLFDKDRIHIRTGNQWAITNALNDDTVTWLCMTYPIMAPVIFNLRYLPRERIEFLQAAFTSAQKLKDRYGQLLILGNLGIAYQEQGRYVEAITCHEQQLDIAKELGDKRNEAAACGNLGIAFQKIGETDKALNYHEMQLDIALEVGNEESQNRAFGGLGIAYQESGQKEKALELHEKQLEIAKKTGDKRGEMAALGNMGVSYRNLNQISRAIDSHNSCIHIARELGDKKSESINLGNLGLCYDCQGDMTSALSLCFSSMELAVEVEDKHTVCTALCNMGGIWLKMGDLYSASRMFSMYLDISRDISNSDGEATALYNLSVVMYLLGRKEEAVRLASESLIIYEKSRSPNIEVVRQKLEIWSDETSTRR